MRWKGGRARRAGHRLRQSGTGAVTVSTRPADRSIARKGAHPSSNHSTHRRPLRAAPLPSFVTHGCPTRFPAGAPPEGRIEDTGSGDPRSTKADYDRLPREGMCTSRSMRDDLHRRLSSHGCPPRTKARCAVTPVESSIRPPAGLSVLSRQPVRAKQKFRNFPLSGVVRPFRYLRSAGLEVASKHRLFDPWKQFA